MFSYETYLFDVLLQPGPRCITLTIKGNHQGNIAQHASNQIQGFMEVAIDGKLTIIPSMQRYADRH